MRFTPSLLAASVLALFGLAATPAPALRAPLAVPATAASAPATATPSTAGPKNEQGLTATIVVNKDSYVLAKDQAGKDFRDKIDAAKNARGGMGGGRLPQPPAVDLTFRISNTTDAPVTISVGGDDSQMNLVLEGVGAISADNNVAMTMEFRIGTPVTLAPGATKDIKISSLAFGMRDISRYAYWTEAGEYTITATLTYGMGEKQGKVTSGPAKVKVTAE